MKIGLDWDGTVTVASELFLNMTKAFMAAGHEVYIVTMRYPSEEGEIAMWRKHVTGVVFTQRMAKKAHCESIGLNIDIWIDDNPEAICRNGKDIWGFVTPEGFVDPHPISSDTEIVCTIAVKTNNISTLNSKTKILGESGIHLTVDSHEPHFARQNYALHQLPLSSKLIAELDNNGLQVHAPVLLECGSIEIVEVKTIQSMDVLRKCVKPLDIDTIATIDFGAIKDRNSNWAITAQPGVFGGAIFESSSIKHKPGQAPKEEGSDSIRIRQIHLSAHDINQVRSNIGDSVLQRFQYLIGEWFPNHEDCDLCYTTMPDGSIVAWRE